MALKDHSDNEAVRSRGQDLVSTCRLTKKTTKGGRINRLGAGSYAACARVVRKYDARNPPLTDSRLRPRGHIYCRIEYGNGEYIIV